MARDPQSERIDEEASLWAARLDGGSLGESDRAALAAWLEADPENRWVLSRYRRLSAQLDEQVEAAAESVAVTRAAVGRRRWRLAGLLGAAAAAVALLVLVLGRPDDFTTKTGERHVATLADGSKVELNAQTELAVDFRRDVRHVRLGRGEALFTVAKNPLRPFVVETPAGLVRVTGTVFNVRATRAERVEVTVLEGTVRVQPARAAGPEALTAGRQATMGVGRVEVRTLPEGAATDAVAWRQGQAVFDNTPLGEALERFGAYDARPVTVEAGAADLRLGGRYSLDDLDGLLEALPRMLPVRVLRGPAGAVRIVVAGAPAQ